MQRLNGVILHFKEVDMRVLIIVSLLVTTISVSTISGQEVSGSSVNAVNDSISVSPTRNDALNVFLNCSSCDRTFIRETVSFINYVNDQRDADVYIMLTRRSTGSGGGEHILALTGLRNYMGINDTLVFFTPPNNPADATRKLQATYISMGLMRFVARTPLAQNINISYRDPSGNGKRLSQVVENDPWDSWIFRVSSRGNYSKDETYENTNFNNSFSANRITPDWKFDFDANLDIRQRSWDAKATYYTADSVKRDTIVSINTVRNEWGFEALNVKSLSPHFSAGLGAAGSGSSHINTRYIFEISPAIEYNFFPYSESFRKQFRLQYYVKAQYVDYIDTTMFFKSEEWLFRQQVSMAITYNQPWGSSRVTLRASHILGDIKAYSLSLYGDLTWRVYKGLSLTMNGRGAITKDDRWMPKKAATLDDVLLQLRRINSRYSYSMGFGLSYSFGSIYNNVVNPRFASERGL